MAGWRQIIESARCREGEGEFQAEQLPGPRNKRSNSAGHSRGTCGAILGSNVLVAKRTKNEGEKKSEAQSETQNRNSNTVRIK